MCFTMDNLDNLVVSTWPEEPLDLEIIKIHNSTEEELVKAEKIRTALFDYAYEKAS